MAAKRRVANAWVALHMDEEGRIVSKVFDPRAWPFDVTDVTGDVKGAVHLLQLGAPVKCVNDDGFLADVQKQFSLPQGENLGD